MFYYILFPQHLIVPELVHPEFHRREGLPILAFQNRCTGFQTLGIVPTAYFDKLRNHL